MFLSSILLTLLVVLVCAILAWRAASWLKVVVLLAGLLISALLFLPGPQLAGIFGKDLIVTLTAWSSATPWSLSDWAHVLIFVALGLLLWLCRPDLRGWKVWLVAGLLAIAAEITQEFSPGRSPKLWDVMLNLLGAAIGLLMGMLLTVLFLRRQQ